MLHARCCPGPCSTTRETPLLWLARIVPVFWRLFAETLTIRSAAYTYRIVASIDGGGAACLRLRV